MHTLRLKVNDKIYDKLLGLLSKFNKDEIEIIADTSDFIKDQKYLTHEYNEILDGTSKFIEMDDVE